MHARMDLSDDLTDLSDDLTDTVNACNDPQAVHTRTRQSLVWEQLSLGRQLSMRASASQQACHQADDPRTAAHSHHHLASMCINDGSATPRKLPLRMWPCLLSSRPSACRLHRSDIPDGSSEMTLPEADRYWSAAHCPVGVAWGWALVAARSCRRAVVRLNQIHPGVIPSQGKSCGASPAGTHPRSVCNPSTAENGEEW